MRSLRPIPKVTWRDKVTNSEVLRKAASTTLEGVLCCRQLRWLGHLIRIVNHSLPKQALYGESVDGRRAAGCQKKRYEDYIKSVLKKFNMDPNTLETDASNRSLWRSLCHSALKLRVDQKTSKLIIFASSRQNFMEMCMNTLNVCSYLLVMIFLD